MKIELRVRRVLGLTSGISALTLLILVRVSHADPCPPGMIFDARFRTCVVSRTAPRPAPMPVPVQPPPRRPTPMPIPAPRPEPVPPIGSRPGGPGVPRPAPFPGTKLREWPAGSADFDEVEAARLVNESVRGRTCEQVADALRNLSNQVLNLGTLTAAPTAPGRPEPDLRRRWREHVRSPAFWQKVWNRMAEVYASCNRTCFDDGRAVGQLSATAYCSASVAVSGLSGPGFIEQPPLPVCETAIFTGCLKSYQSTAVSFPGCSAYMGEGYQSTFNEYQSQDCHL